MTIIYILAVIGGLVVAAAIISALVIVAAYVAGRMGLLGDFDKGYDDE